MADRVINITVEHAKIHAGELFFFADRQTTGSVLSYLFRVGPTPLHIRDVINVGAGVQIDIYRDVLVTGITTLGTIQNYNLASTNVLKSKIYTSFTYSGGTLYKPNYAGSGANPGSATNGMSSSDLEYVFAPQKDYVIVLTPSTSNIMLFLAILYEQDILNVDH